MNPYSKTNIAIVVSPFGDKLGYWTSTRDRCILDLKTVDEQVDFVRTNFNIGDAILNKLDYVCTFSQGALRTSYEYNDDFDCRFKPWKNYMSLRASFYMYIGGLPNGLLQTDLIANWESSKYSSLKELQLDAENITLHRYTIS